MLSQKTEESIFHAAREIESDRERAEFLDRECGEDQSLRRRLDALLAAHLNDPDYLHVSPIKGGSLLDSSSDPGLTACLGNSNQPGDVIGAYRIREQIGEGGMGVVYVAEQTDPVKRRVALKVIKPGMDSRQVIARFEAERQALAVMDHPNIARVIDGGTTESGRPYFAMDLVRGLPICEYCNKHRLDTRARLNLFLDVCDAVQHAHQKGIIHRDLKPTNVLVTRNGDRAIPKVIDFGLAKATGYRLTERSIYTNFHQMIGTPLYMSPEQAELSELNVDIRSDIYSLGVILYELMTGDTPFERERLNSVGYDELRRIIREDDPLRPSERVSTLKAEAITTLCDTRRSDFAKIHQQLRGELDWVVMKALDKDRGRRYQSASEFADDVRRFLDDEPVEACPPTLSYRVRKYVRRHRVLVASAALVMLTAGLGTCASLVFANHAMIAAEDAEEAATRAEALAQQRDEAAKRMAVEAQKARLAEEVERQQRLTAQQARYRADIRVSESRLQQRDDAVALRTLLEHLPVEGNEDLRRWEWYYLLGKTRMSERGWYAHRLGLSAKWLADETKIFTMGSDSPNRWEVRVWDAGYNSLLHQIPNLAPKNKRPFINHIPGTTSVWSDGYQNREGNRIAFAYVRPSRESKVFRRNTDKWELEYSVNGVVRTAGWSSDDRYFVGLKTGKFFDASPLCLYDGKTLQPVKEIDLDVGLRGYPIGQCHPTKQWIALKGSNDRILIVDLETEQRIAELNADQAIRNLSWSPDGTAIAVAGDKGLIQVWNVEGWKLGDQISAHSTHAQSVSWSPDCRRLVSIGSDGYCAIWSLDRQDLRRSRKISAQRHITSFTWTDDDTIQYSWPRNQVESFRVSDGSTETILRTNDFAPWRMAAANRVLQFTEAEEVHVEVRDLENMTARQLKTLLGISGQRTWGLSPDGKQLAIATKPPQEESAYHFELIDIKTGQCTPIELQGVRFCQACVWSPDGKRIAIVGSGSDRKHLQSIHLVDTVKDLSIREKQIGFLGWGNQLMSVAWNADGSTLVVGGMDGWCEVLDSKTLATIVRSRPSAGAAIVVAWHPSDDRIASASTDGIVAVWDVTTGEALLDFEVDKDVHQLNWSPNGQRLAARMSSGEIMIWDASEGYRRSASNTLSEHRRRREKASPQTQNEQSLPAQGVQTDNAHFRPST